MYFIQSTNNLEETIRECFATDAKLLEKFHIAAPSSLDVCVSKTMNDFENQFDKESFKFYRAYECGELVGYWGTEKDKWINFIFVKPQYRTGAYMAEFWDAVVRTMPEEFGTAVYAKNKPAVNFYKKLASEYYTGFADGHPAMSFKFKKVRK